ncbi:MAG: hypothetical protein ABR985_11445 [Methanotrichaceae archaeon]
MVKLGVLFILVLAIIALPVGAKMDSFVNGPYNISFDLSGAPDIGSYNVGAFTRTTQELGPTESDRDDAWLMVTYKAAIKSDTAIALVKIMEQHDPSKYVDLDASMRNRVEAEVTAERTNLIDAGIEKDLVIVPTLCR